MSSRWTAGLAALATLALSPSLVFAASDTEVQQQLQQMQQRMQQMEDELQATTDQLDSANQRVDEQSRVIEQSGLAETRGASNGLPGFLGQITVGGWVSATYFWNVNHPTDENRAEVGGNVALCDPPDDCGGGVGNTNIGDNGKFYPLSPDHNSFALDQVWFEIERPIDEENRAGFRFDPVMGQSASLINGFGGPSNRGSRDNSAFYISQGYVQYLAPVAGGITIKAGKFNTPIGVEVVQTIYNWNITRGIVWSLLQPIDHIGLMATGKVGDTGFDYGAGIVNGFLPDSPDRNQAKTALGHIGWSNDAWTLAGNIVWGGETSGHDSNEQGVADAIIKFKASDRLAMYLNGDYAWRDMTGNPDAWGISLAGRFGITDRTGIALRGEYATDNDNYFGFSGISTATNKTCPTGFNNGQLFNACPVDTHIWSITGTLDHLLTDQLMIRGEVRWDVIDKSGTNDAEFSHGNADNHGSYFGLKGNQLVLGAEVVYNFNKFGGE